MGTTQMAGDKSVTYAGIIPRTKCDNGFQHMFSLKADGVYTCDTCGQRSDGGDAWDGNTFVDGYQCRVCRVRWLTDQEKPCSCEVQMMTTSAMATWPMVHNVVAPPIPTPEQPTDHAND